MFTKRWVGGREGGLEGDVSAPSPLFLLEIFYRRAARVPRASRGRRERVVQYELVSISSRSRRLRHDEAHPDKRGGPCGGTVFA